MVIGEPNNVFKLGLMVAPVSDWRYYGKIISSW